MDGPRNPTAGEMDAIAALNDGVFFKGAEREMFRRWPAVFNDSHRHNLFVCVEEGRVLSHAAMVIRDVILEGGATRVACLGAVCTAAAARGRGLATRCVEAAFAKGHSEGCDFVLISGDLPIYRRLGAVECGFKFTVSLSRDAARALPAMTVAIVPATPADIPACAALHARSATRFVRPREDWDGFFSSGMCINRFSTLWRIRVSGHDAAYCFVSNPGPGRLPEMLEWGGDATAFVAGLRGILTAIGAESLLLHLTDADALVLGHLEAAGAQFHCSPNDFGTVLLLDAPRLVSRMRPLFAARMGMRMAESVSVEVDGMRYAFRAGGGVHVAEGAGAAAQYVFGCPGAAASGGPQGGAFPIPLVWYGLNYF